MSIIAQLLSLLFSVVPEGIMTAPFYYPLMAKLPDYLLYAGIGHIIAHEFLHTMDTTGWHGYQ